MNDLVIAYREFRENFGDDITIEVAPMKNDKRTVYPLDSEEAIEELMRKLSHDWRKWMLDGREPMEVEVRFTRSTEP